jgi:hypothetical protein
MYRDRFLILRAFVFFVVNIILRVSAPLREEFLLPSAFFLLADSPLRLRAFA